MKIPVTCDICLAPRAVHSLDREPVVVAPVIGPVAVAWTSWPLCSGCAHAIQNDREELVVVIACDGPENTDVDRDAATRARARFDQLRLEFLNGARLVV